MTGNEKALLEFIVEQQKNLLDYMERNNCEFEVSIDIKPHRKDVETDIYADITERYDSGDLKRIAVLHDGKNGRCFHEYHYEEKKR